MEQRTEHMDEQLAEQKTERESRRMTEQAADHRTEQTAGFSVYEELHMTLRDLINRKKEIEKQIEQNNLQIHEAECFTEEILSKDEEDFTVFSPRKYEEIYRDELDASNMRKRNYEHINRELSAEKEKLEKMIFLLDAVSTDWKAKSGDAKQEEEVRSQEEAAAQVNKEILLQAQEREYQRLTSIMNDNLLQKLYFATHKIEVGSKFISQDTMRARQEFGSVKNQIQDSITEIRSLIYQICPLDMEHLHLKQTLEKMLSEFNRRGQYDLSYRIDMPEQVDTSIQVTVYRLIQECFVNIKKHAEAKKVRFQCLKNEDRIEIVVEDDGKGFDPDQIDAKCNGIAMMKGRVFLLDGTMEILSAKEEGTKIRIEIPVDIPVENIEKDSVKDSVKDSAKDSVEGSAEAEDAVKG